MSKKSIAESIPVETTMMPPAVVTTAPPVVVPITAPQPQAADVIPCRDCRHWRKPWPKANVGECDISRRYLASPIYTPSLASCDEATL